VGEGPHRHGLLQRHKDVTAVADVVKTAVGAALQIGARQNVTLRHSNQPVRVLRAVAALPPVAGPGPADGRALLLLLQGRRPPRAAGARPDAAGTLEAAVSAPRLAGHGLVARQSCGAVQSPPFKQALVRTFRCDRQHTHILMTARTQCNPLLLLAIRGCTAYRRQSNGWACLLEQAVAHNKCVGEAHRGPRSGPAGAADWVRAKSPAATARMQLTGRLRDGFRTPAATSSGAR